MFSFCLNLGGRIRLLAGRQRDSKMILSGLLGGRFSGMWFCLLQHFEFRFWLSFVCAAVVLRLGGVWFVCRVPLVFILSLDVMVERG